MSMSNSTNFRLRVIDGSYTEKWQQVNEYNDIADDLIQTPDKYLLTKDQLFDAEGGVPGMAL